MVVVFCKPSGLKHISAKHEQNIKYLHTVWSHHICKYVHISMIHLLINFAVICNICFKHVPLASVHALDFSTPVCTMTLVTLWKPLEGTTHIEPWPKTWISTWLCFRRLGPAGPPQRARAPVDSRTDRRSWAPSWDLLGCVAMVVKSGPFVGTTCSPGLSVENKRIGWLCLGLSLV